MKLIKQFITKIRVKILLRKCKKYLKKGMINFADESKWKYWTDLYDACWAKLVMLVLKKDEGQQ